MPGTSFSRPVRFKTSPKDELGYFSLSASSYLEIIHDKVTGRPPLIDLELESKIQEFLRDSINNRSFRRSREPFISQQRKKKCLTRKKHPYHKCITNNNNWLCINNFF